MRLHSGEFERTVKTFNYKEMKDEAYEKMINENESFWLLWTGIFCYESLFRQVGKTRGNTVS